MGTLNDDFFVNGFLSAKSMKIPDSTISDAAINGAANIATGKLQHRFHVKSNQPNTTATSETRPIFVAYGTTGLVLGFRAGSIAPCSGAAAITVDLKKNGVSILSAPITLDNSKVARTVYAATLVATAVAAGDFFEVVVVATAGGGTLGTGLFCEMVIDETPS